MGWTFIIAVVGVLIGFAALMAVISRMRRDTGGGFGPTELSDGSITSEPTGYPEDADGSSRKPDAAANEAADYK
ncbi:MAG: hypothetical protein R3338_12700 [Thermoanaerobaculia bacterium]|nr:hypothetical protein [Thermoanaerobaculia bacterium]